VTVQPGQTVNLAFGNRRKQREEPGRICVLKFFDRDGDGVHDAQERPVFGTKIVVLDADGNKVAEGTIGKRPTCFTLPPGTYSVKELVSAPWVGTTPNPQTVKVTSGQTAVVEFGNRLVEAPPKVSGEGTICVAKYFDRDGDGRRDPDEPYVEGIRFTITDETGKVVARGQTARKPVCFTLPAPRTYRVRELPSVAWTTTTANPVVARLKPGEKVNVTFGNKRKRGIIQIPPRRRSIPPGVKRKHRRRMRRKAEEKGKSKRGRK